MWLMDMSARTSVCNEQAVPVDTYRRQIDDDITIVRGIYKPHYQRSRLPNISMSKQSCIQSSSESGGKTPAPGSI